MCCNDTAEYSVCDGWPNGDVGGGKLRRLVCSCRQATLELGTEDTNEQSHVYIVLLFDVRLSVSQSQGLIAIPQDNRHIHLYDINGVRYGRPTKMSKVRCFPVLLMLM